MEPLRARAPVARGDGAGARRGDGAVRARHRADLRRRVGRRAAAGQEQPAPGGARRLRHLRRGRDARVARPRGVGPVAARPRVRRRRRVRPRHGLHRSHRAVAEVVPAAPRHRDRPRGGRLRVRRDGDVARRAAAHGPLPGGADGGLPPAGRRLPGPRPARRRAAEFAARAFRRGPGASRGGPAQRAWGRTGASRGGPARRARASRPYRRAGAAHPAVVPARGHVDRRGRGGHLADLDDGGGIGRRRGPRRRGSGHRGGDARAVQRRRPHRVGGGGPARRAVARADGHPRRRGRRPALPAAHHGSLVPRPRRVGLPLLRRRGRRSACATRARSTA